MGPGRTQALTQGRWEPWGLCTEKGLDLTQVLTGALWPWQKGQTWGMWMGVQRPRLGPLH